MPLSDATIRTLKPRDKAYKVADYEVLFLTVKPTGSRLWHFKYRIAAKEKLLSLGIYPSVSLAQARAARDAARALLASGADPGEAKQDRKREDQEWRGQTFEKLATAYTAKTVKEGKATATLAKTEWLLGIANAEIGTKPMPEITSPMVLRYLHKVEAKGNYETAKRLRAVIGAVFRYAIANGNAETDPTYALRDAIIRSTVTPRAAITDTKAQGGLLRAIDGFHGQASTFSNSPFERHA